MSTTRIRIGVVVVFLLASSLGSFAAFPVSGAQDLGGQPSQVVPERDLQLFANAYLKVSEIYNAYEPLITSAGDADRARALQQEANEKMNQAVKDEGLSVPEYNAIFSLVNEDESLQKHVNKLLKQQ